MTRYFSPSRRDAPAGSSPKAADVECLLAKSPVRVDPLASLQYTNVHVDGYSERGSFSGRQGFRPSSAIRDNWSGAITTRTALRVVSTSAVNASSYDRYLGPFRSLGCERRAAGKAHSRRLPPSGIKPPKLVD